MGPISPPRTPTMTILISPPRTPTISSSSSSSLMMTPPLPPIKINKQQQRLQLLHLIDKAIKKSEILLKEYRRIQKTPQAINAERNRKIGILMSFLTVVETETIWGWMLTRVSLVFIWGVFQLIFKLCFAGRYDILATMNKREAAWCHIVLIVMDYAAGGGGNFFRGCVMLAGLEKMSFMKGSHPYDNMSKRMVVPDPLK
ncbi:hypothetical protein TSUD_244740 [Trifolium subterraneum]|uniref:Transmembrane protein n=1 Tax=Trifolium subterraneum TaxID=3900 RepID=A0A2Z6PW32_TRISU|nr:hypothetical protein TSUD_244740 [Trifolium subterraneum]